MIEHLSYDAFVSRLGEQFTVNLEDGTAIPLRLTQATDRLDRSDPASRETVGGLAESFSLLFVGPDAQPLSQGTYEFSHAALGSFPLFIVPVALDANGMQYEVIFNRLPPARASAP